MQFSHIIVLIKNWPSWSIRWWNSENDPATPIFVVVRSRSEQAPGSGFHPRDKSTKIYCGFLGPRWCNTNIDPER